MSSKSYSAAYDQRTQFGSGSGLQVAPGGAVVSPGAGAVNAAAGSSVHQTITTRNEGFVADDVAQILGMIEEDRAGERQTFSALGQSLAAGVLAQADTTAATLAATKAPDSTTLTKLVPLMVVLVLAYVLLR
jgi:hypothetical protein